MRDKVAIKDAALLAALSLLGSTRMTPTLKDQLTKTILPGLNIKVACGFEEQIIVKGAEIINRERGRTPTV